VRPLIRSRRF